MARRRTRRGRRTTKRGMTRRTSRRAYAPRRRKAPVRRRTRRRKNPKNPFFSPAAMMAVGGVGGVVVGNALNLSRMPRPLAGVVPGGLNPSVIVGVLLAMFGGQFVRGRNRQYTVALGVGMIAAPYLGTASQQIAGVFGGNGARNGALPPSTTTSTTQIASTGAFRQAQARHYANAARAAANGATSDRMA